MIKNDSKYYWQLLYDEECNYCNKFANIIEKFDNGKIKNISLQEHYKLYGTISIDDLLEEVHLLGKNGEVLKGSDAVNKIILLVPESKPFRWLIESRWGKKGTDLLYGVIKRFRKCSKCKKKR